MKNPCKTCPFKISNNFYLRRDRALDIVHAITHDGGFHCHSTVDYSQLESKGVVTKDSQLCFGASLFLEHVLPGGCRGNVIFRLAIKYKEFGVDDLRIDDDIYNSIDAFVDGVSFL